MIDSLYISLSGMTAFTNQLRVESNNISNAETTGYKASSVNFSDILAQSITRTESDNSGRGVSVESVTENWTQGSISSVDSTTSLAINGSGLFALKDPGTGITYYTRDGSFEFNKSGQLVNSDGLIVQGYTVDDNGNFGSLTDIKVSYANSPPKATTTFSTTLNLNSGADDASTFESTINIYDSLGNEIPVTITYTKSTTANEWTWSASIDSQYGSITSGDSGTFTFDSDGNLTSGTDPVLGLTYTNGATSQSVTWDLYDDSSNTKGTLTQYSSTSVLSAKNQDGYAAGELTSVTIDDSGYVVCSYSNDTTKNLYQVALADFTNYNGLKKCDGNLYKATLDSGQATMGHPGVGKCGTISSSSLEMSNVDLSTELTQLIVTQTAYQACSKAFSTTNELLKVLFNMTS